MKSYTFNLVYVENEEMDFPNKAKSFTIGGGDIAEVLRRADKLLYGWDVTGHLEDFTDDNYNYDETRFTVSYGDSERGLKILYEVEEI